MHCFEIHQTSYHYDKCVFIMSLDNATKRNILGFHMLHCCLVFSMSEASLYLLMIFTSWKECAVTGWWHGYGVDSDLDMNIKEKWFMRCDSISHSWQPLLERDHKRTVWNIVKISGTWTRVHRKCYKQQIKRLNSLQLIEEYE